MSSLASLRRWGKPLMALALALGLSSSPALSAPQTLDQGWDTDNLRERFYYTTQGSLLMPYEWFLALENADSQELFHLPGNMTRFGWVMPIQSVSDLNPNGLPAGFVKDNTQWNGMGPWVGMTCAACHTADVSYKGATFRIDGAPTQADFGGFMSALGQAVDATLTSSLQLAAGGDGSKFLRFATRVYGHVPSKAEATALAGQYAVFATPFIGDVRLRTPQLPAGHGRVDALTQIINALSVTDLQQPGNARNPAAPVSYPFLWTTPRQLFVQWNPVASSPIARNLGEALGVFSPAVFTPPITKLDTLFSNSANLNNLYELEEWVADLKPPQWPEQAFGPIDQAKAARGKAIFDQECRACHNMPPFTLTDPKDNVAGKQFLTIGRVDYKDIQTDPVYVESLISRTALTGALSKIPLPRLKPPFAQPMFTTPVVPGATFFTSTVGETLLASMLRDRLTPEQIMAYNDYRFYPAQPGKLPAPYSPPSVTDLKAGPLLGIWATGPFLHNGSVPTVYDLLSPPAERPKSFYVGGSELDVQKLGFLSLANELSTEDKARLSFYDTSLPGNSNSGHTYPARGLSSEERYQVIEYLKSANLTDADKALLQSRIYTPPATPAKTPAKTSTHSQTKHSK